MRFVTRVLDNKSYVFPRRERAHRQLMSIPLSARASGRVHELCLRCGSFFYSSKASEVTSLRRQPAHVVSVDRVEEVLSASDGVRSVAQQPEYPLPPGVGDAPGHDGNLSTQLGADLRGE